MNKLIDSDIQKRFEVNGISKQIRDDQYDVLQTLVADSFHPNMKAVEIGSWTGLSAVIIGEVVKRANGKLLSVDWYQGSADGATHLKDTAEYIDVPQIFIDNVEYFKLNNHVSLLISSSEEASTLFEDETVNFIFIDGDHTYEGATKDITLWYPKLKKGSIICGHDYEDNNSEVCKAVINYFNKVNCWNDIWWIRKPL